MYLVLFYELPFIDGMRAYFEQFGQVTECHIMRDPTGKSRCFGFVSFADTTVVDAVVSKTHILDNKQVQNLSSSNINM